MRRFSLSTVVFLLSLPLYAADKPPLWVTDNTKAFPNKEWISVVDSGKSKDAVQSAAYSSLAAVFRVDVKAVTQSNHEYAHVMRETQGKKITRSVQSESFSSFAATTSDVSGLIGVETDVYTAADGTVWVNARMNRKECSARYAALVKENSAVIDTLKEAAAAKPAAFDAYSALNMAVLIAQTTDNFQSILEVLDAAASSRRPSYGGANTLKQLRSQCARSITIAVDVDVHGEEESTIVTRAFGSFFKDRGFKTRDGGDDGGMGGYTLKADLLIERTETSASGPKVCRYYLNAALEDASGDAVFSFEGNGRQNHNNISEAYRRALRAAEASIKTGDFAKEFDAFLLSLIE
jgi:hypothetical protein